EGRSPERSERREVRLPPAEDLLEVPDEDDRDFLPPPASARPSAPIDDDLELEDEPDQEVAGGHAGHKKIPTWQDAVGLLIDANMATRANSPDRGHRGRRGGRGR